MTENAAIFVVSSPPPSHVTHRDNEGLAPGRRQDAGDGLLRVPGGPYRGLRATEEEGGGDAEGEADAPMEEEAGGNESDATRTRPEGGSEAGPDAALPEDAGAASETSPGAAGFHFEGGGGARGNGLRPGPGAGGAGEERRRPQRGGRL
ncbi:hypothetical protein THAOC_26421, partial [Thalassiosira oceanica]